MSAAEVWILLIGVIATCLSYWRGRIDGYWSRADEERAREQEKFGAPNV